MATFDNEKFLNPMLDEGPPTSNLISTGLDILRLEAEGPRLNQRRWSMRIKLSEFPNDIMNHFTLPLEA